MENNKQQFLRKSKYADSQTRGERASQAFAEGLFFRGYSISSYVLQKIDRGLKDAEKGRVYTQEEVEKMMAKWLEK